MEKRKSVRTGVLVALLVLALLAGYGLLGTSYLKQHRQQESLNARLAEASRVLAQLPAPAADLEQRLVAAQANLAEVESRFPGQVNSTLVVDAVLQLAEGIGVKAVPLATQAWRAEKNGKHSYYALRLAVSVKGSLSQVVDFIQGLENGTFPTLVLERLTASQEAESPAGEATAGPVSATIELAVYAAKPPAD